MPHPPVAEDSASGMCVDRASRPHMPGRDDQTTRRWEEHYAGRRVGSSVTRLVTLKFVTMGEQVDTFLAPLGPMTTFVAAW